MVLYEEEFHQMQAVVDRLVREANARVVLIIDKNGILLCSAGDSDSLDATSFAPLAAGNVAATGGIAKLLRENEFTTQYHEGENANVHIQIVGNRVILVVIFDTKSSIGLVRLRCKKASEQLVTVLDSLDRRAADPENKAVFGEITDADIDNLFND